MGLMGVWGSLIEEWLNSLLPDDAADRCRWVLHHVFHLALEGRQFWSLPGAAVPVMDRLNSQELFKKIRKHLLGQVKEVKAGHVADVSAYRCQEV